MGFKKHDINEYSAVTDRVLEKDPLGIRNITNETVKVVKSRYDEKER